MLSNWRLHFYPLINYAANFVKDPLSNLSNNISISTRKYNLNLNIVKAEAEEAEERAGLSEQAMSKLRVIGRAGSAAPFL